MQKVFCWLRSSVDDAHAARAFRFLSSSFWGEGERRKRSVGKNAAILMCRVSSSWFCVGYVMVEQWEGGAVRVSYLISGKVHRPVFASVKGPRNMPLMVGLTSVASRRTTNSNPSPETRVTYLLGASSARAILVLLCVEGERLVSEILTGKTLQFRLSRCANKSRR